MRNTGAIRPLLNVAAALLAVVAAVPAAAQDSPTGSWNPETAGGTFLLGAAASDGIHLYVVGGMQDGADLDAFRMLNRYDPASDTWMPRAMMPRPIMDNAAACLGGRLYSIGGSDLESGLTNAIYAYDIASNTWSTMSATLSSPRNALAAATLGSVIHVAGGFESDVSSVHEVFDPATDTVTARPSLPTGMMYPAMTAAAGNLYVAGGLVGATPQATTYEFSPGAISWTTVNPLPVGLYAAAAFSLQDRVYLVGGVSGGRENSTWELNPSTGAWARRANMGVAREFHGGAAIGGRGYVYGGFETSSGEEFTAPEFAPPPANVAPTANAGADRTITATSATGASVELNGSLSNDPEGDLLVFAWTGSFGTAGGPRPTVPLAIGTHNISLTVTDSAGATGSDSVQVTVEDVAPPSHVTLRADPSVIKANGEMKKVRIQVRTDDCDRRPHARIVSVTSNQPVGSKACWKITGSLTVKLRAECTNGQERIYTITVRTTDSSGNSSLSSVDVKIKPKQPKQKKGKKHDDDDDDDDGDDD